jgi:hypothetical protein
MALLDTLLPIAHCPLPLFTHAPTGVAVHLLSPLPSGRGREAMTCGRVHAASCKGPPESAAASHVAELVRGKLGGPQRPPHPARLAEGEPPARQATFSPRGEGLRSVRCLSCHPGIRRRRISGTGPHMPCTRYCPLPIASFHARAVPPRPCDRRCDGYAGASSATAERIAALQETRAGLLGNPCGLQGLTARGLPSGTRVGDFCPRSRFGVRRIGAPSTLSLIRQSPVRRHC